MNDTEKEKFRQIGIDLINEYRAQGGLSPIHFLPINTPEVSAFIRSIQLHEKTKKELADCKQELSDFRQEVGDAAAQVVKFLGRATTDHARGRAALVLTPFIIPAVDPDPLIEVLRSVGGDDRDYCDYPEYVKEIRAALEARGLEIREKNDD